MIYFKPIVSRTSEEVWMGHAISEALKGIGKSAPNPPVGCVIVKNNLIIGRGHHIYKNYDHAEIVALKSCQESPQGATAYITLEPCSSTGRTGPCTQALINAGIQKVVFGSIDPNIKNHNQSQSILAQNQIQTISGIHQFYTDQLIASFTTVQNKKRPHIILKCALSLDGKIATTSGDSKWITNGACRNWVHSLRAKSNAIIVGGKTVRSDDPHLTIRTQERLPQDQPYRIILTNQSIPHTAHIFQDDPSRCKIYSTQRISVHPKAQLYQLPQSPSLHLSYILQDCLKDNIHTILVEGGSQIHQLFLEANLWDDCFVCQAPFIIGGDYQWLKKNFTKSILDAKNGTYCVQYHHYQDNTIYHLKPKEG